LEALKVSISEMHSLASAVMSSQSCAETADEILTDFTDLRDVSGCFHLRLGGEGEDAFLHLKLITLMVSHVR
jgi:hypothetical protein